MEKAFRNPKKRPHQKSASKSAKKRGFSKFDNKNSKNKNNKDKSSQYKFSKYSSLPAKPASFSKPFLKTESRPASKPANRGEKYAKLNRAAAPINQARPIPQASSRPIPNKEPFPMRINKYLALKKHSTRRGADELIEKKQVFINGRLAVLGDKVNLNDVVEIRFRQKPKAHIYLAYNKPIGVITHSPQEGEKEIKDVVGVKDVFPVGRLDKNSHGLIILTDDGRITDRLLNPDVAHEKEYVVSVQGKLRSNFKERMESGVTLEDGEVTKKCKVSIVNDHVFRIILTEGKKHQIRRMCSALFQEVKDLKRIRVMNIHLGSLPEGAHRKIEGKELENFLSLLGL